MARTKGPRPNSKAEAEFGIMPKGIDLNEVGLSEQIRVLNWFNYKHTPKEGRDLLEKLLPEIEWASVRSVEVPLTFAWMYMAEKANCILSTDMLAKRNALISDLTEKYPRVKTKKVEVVSDEVVNTYPDKTHLATFCDIEDEFWKTFNLVEAVNKVKVLLSTITKGQTQEIGNSLKSIIDELEEVSKDKDLKEGYKTYNSSNIRVAKKFYATVLEHIGFVSSVKRVVRTRKKKVIPIAKKLQNLKYLKISDPFKLVSVDPEKIIGANIVWTFNTKSRDLSKMISDTGFDVKGSTLQNGTSVKTKKIRKIELLKQVVETTKVRMDKEFEALKVNERDGNYRINAETIIVKAFTN